MLLNDWLKEHGCLEEREVEAVRLVPLCVLYESCIWIAWLVERRQAKS
jgi:hypothetical protein